MDERVEALAERLEAASIWPDDVLAMKAIRRCAEEGGRDLSPLVPELIARLESGDEWSTEAAVRTLAATGDPRAVEPLIRALEFVEHGLPDDLGPDPDHAVLAHAQVAHDEDRIRLSSARALGQLGQASALPALRACAADEREMDAVRHAAREAIALLEAAIP